MVQKVWSGANQATSSVHRWRRSQHNRGTLLYLILNIPGGFSLDGCNATSKNNHKGYFAFVTTDGWHFDFEAEDQPIGPISLIVGNSLGPLDPFLADAQKILWEEVVPYLEAEYGIKMREAEA